MTPVSGTAETQQRLPVWDIRLLARQMIITYGQSAISHSESMPPAGIISRVSFKYGSYL